MSGKTEPLRPDRQQARNAQLERAIFQSLGHSSHLELRHISVAVDNQRVVLSGTVPSFYLKQIAQETARRTCPGRRVYNDLNVVQAG